MTTLLLTCEHAVNAIPPEFAGLVKIPKEILDSHRGWDAGAMELCDVIFGVLKCEKKIGGISRLLVDLNRSPKSRNLFSSYSRDLSQEWRDKIMKTCYLPYREGVEEMIKRHIGKREKILHLSMHSFTPELNGNIRENDLGILYDPARRDENIISEKIKVDLLEKIPGMKIRKNYPYLGTSDGFTTYLRKKYAMKNYIGIEIEINQRMVFNDHALFKRLKASLPEIIQSITENP